MKNEAVIKSTQEYVRKNLEGEGSGHDWWHVHRVWNLALRIGKEERADIYVVQLAALLHDIADYKLHSGNENIGPATAKAWLNSLDVEDSITSHVCGIMHDMSFKGAGVKTGMKTIEGMVVQDSDRLDAIGAIGIARAFAYGGFMKREMHNPDIKPQMHSSFDEYKNAKGTTANHFYEKLLLLKNLMNTDSAKRIAEERHAFMEQYLSRFFREWEGERL